jgi:hypothetical protein
MGQKPPRLSSSPPVTLPFPPAAIHLKPDPIRFACLVLRRAARTWRGRSSS